MTEPLEGQHTLPGFEGLPTRPRPAEPESEPPRPRQRHRQGDLLVVPRRRGAPLDFRGQVLAAGRALAQARRRKLATPLLAEAEKRLRKLLARARAR